MNIKASKERVFKRFKSSGYVLFDQAILSGTNFLTGILLARFLGIETYGLFALLWMIVLFGLSFSQAFVTKPMLSLGPQKESEDQNHYYSSLHAIQLIFSGLSFVLSCFGLLVFISFFRLELPSFGLLLKVPIILALFLNYDFYRKYFFVSERLKWPIIIDGLLATFQLVGFSILYLNDALSIESVLTLLVLVYVFINGISFVKCVFPDFEMSNLKKTILLHFEYAKWLIGTALLQWLCGNFFIIAGGGILGTAAVGAIRIAQNVIGLTHVIFLAMENIVPVYAAKRFKAGGIRSLYQFLKKLSLQSGLVILVHIDRSVFVCSFDNKTTLW